MPPSSFPFESTYSIGSQLVGVVPMEAFCSEKRTPFEVVLNQSETVKLFADGSTVEGTVTYCVVPEKPAAPSMFPLVAVALGFVPLGAFEVESASESELPFGKCQTAL